MFIRVLCIVVFVTHCSNNQKNKQKKVELRKDFVLKIGYLEYPPLTYTNEQGVPDGLFINIAKKTLTHAGIKYTAKGYPAGRFYKYLVNGEVHLFLGIKTIPELKDKTIVSNARNGSIEMRVFTIGKKKEITRKEDLVGKKVIIVRGFSYSTWGSWIRDKKNGVKFIETNSHEAAFEMLERGRANYLLNYKYISRFVLKNKEIKNLQHKTLFNWQCYFVLSNKIANASNILRKMDNSYKALIKSGGLVQQD